MWICIFLDTRKYYQQYSILGRPSLYMTLREFALNECNKFWVKMGEKISAFEKLKVLAVTGGVPRYLELINPNITAEINTNEMCFKPNAPLLNEFKFIFYDIFGKRSSIYKKIIGNLLNGVALKYIQPNKTKISKGMFVKNLIAALSGRDSIIALQFENLVLNNELHIIDILGINLADVIFLNPYFQKQTKRHLGCQIDLMIQTKFNNLYICEIKFSKNPITTTIISELQQKIERLSLPKNFSYRLVLIHAKGVNENVIESGFIAKIIDFGELLMETRDEM